MIEEHWHLLSSSYNQWTRSDLIPSSDWIALFTLKYSIILGRLHYLRTLHYLRSPVLASAWYQSALLNRLRNHADYPSSPVKCLLRLVKYKIISLFCSHYQKEIQHFQNIEKLCSCIEFRKCLTSPSMFLLSHSIVLLIVLSFISP